MEDFIQNESIKFEDEKLDALVQHLNEIFRKRQDNFAELCTCVAKIYYYCKDHKYKAKDNEYYDATKLLGKFGFEPRQYQRIVKCYEKFILESNHKNDVDVANLKPLFFLFSPTKLFELLSVSNEQLLSDIDKKILKPEMTQKQIREYVKKLKGGENEQNKVLEKPSVDSEEETEYLEFYSIDTHYEQDFFESCNHGQLVMIAMTLQFEFEKLKNSFNEKVKLKVTKELEKLKEV